MSRFFLLYIYIYNNVIIFNLIKKLFNFYLDNIVIILLVFFFLFFHKTMTEFLTISIKIFFCEEKYITLYFHERNSVFFSIFIVMLFIFYYVIYLRIMIFFNNREFDINIFVLKSNLVHYADNCNYNNIIIYFTIFFLISLFYLVTFFLVSLIFFFTKKHFLKLHYYYFCRIFTYNLFFQKINDTEKIFLKIFGNFYFHFVFLLNNFLRIYILFLIFYSLFFENGDMSKIFKIMPYYSLYFFILNIYNFIVKSFKEDFDILIMESYYKKIKFYMELNEFKKQEYKKYLLFNNSKFKFKDCIYLFFKNEIEENFITIQTYKYTINSYPNNFFNKIKNIKPEFIKKQ